MARPDRWMIDVTGLVPTRQFNKNKQPLVERLITMWSHYAVLNPAWTFHPNSRCGEYTQMIEDLLLAKNNVQAGAVWNAALAWGVRWGVEIRT